MFLIPTYFIILQLTTLWNMVCYDVLSGGRIKYRSHPRSVVTTVSEEEEEGGKSNDNN